MDHLSCRIPEICVRASYFVRGMVFFTAAIIHLAICVFSILYKRYVEYVLLCTLVILIE